VSAVPAPTERAKPKSFAFRKKYSAPRLSPDSACRQGEITHLAFSRLGGRDPALAFLNGTDAALGGRPIDIAIASDEGYTKVEQAICAQTPLPPVAEQ